jgi:hypothetical protein
LLGLGGHGYETGAKKGGELTHGGHDTSGARRPTQAERRLEWIPQPVWSLLDIPPPVPRDSL